MNAMQKKIPLRKAVLLDRGGVICLVGAGGKTSLMFRLARELAVAGDRVLTTTTTKISEREATRNVSEIVTGPLEILLDRAGGGPKSHACMTAARDGYDGKLIGFGARDIDRLWQAGLFDWIIVEADGAARLPLKAPDAHEPVIPGCCHCVIGVAGLTAFEKPLSDQWVFRMRLFARLTGLDPGDRITAAAVAASLGHPNGIFKGTPRQSRRVVFLNQADTPERLAAGRHVTDCLTKQYQQSGIQRAILGQLLFDPPVIEFSDF